MKLSKTQQKVLEEARAYIETARKYETFEEYFIAEKAKRCNCMYNTPEKYKARNMKGWKSYEELWKQAKFEGIALTTANTRTLEALAKSGMIEIIKIGGSYTDRIKVL